MSTKIPIAIMLLGAALGACMPEDEGYPDGSADMSEAAPARDRDDRMNDSTTAAAQRVEVGLTEFAIQLSSADPAGASGASQQSASPTLQTGTVTFQVRNDGAMAHSFEIEGQGIERELPKELGPGETGTVTVELAPGTYRIYCPVEDHEDRGMAVDVVVQ